MEVVPLEVEEAGADKEGRHGGRTEGGRGRERETFILTISGGGEGREGGRGGREGVVEDPVVWVESVGVD